MNAMDPLEVNFTYRPSARLHRPGALLSLILGLAAFSSTPQEGTADFLRIQLGSYVITYFDLLVAFATVVLLVTSRLRFQLDEKRVAKALFFVICTRVISLVIASQAALEQVASILRYVETLLVIAVLANLLSCERNRRYFIAGACLGAAVETAGGLWILLASSGDARGVWLGTDNYKWQVYFLFVCILFFAAKKHLITCALFGVTLLVGIISTETRAALVLLLIMAVVWVGTHRSSVGRPLLISTVLVALTLGPVLQVFPGLAKTMEERLEQLWSGGGVIGYRVVLFEMAVSAFLNHPITGIGSGGFSRQQNALYLNVNDAFSTEYVTAYGNLSTHNTFLGVAAETGLVGLCAYLVWVYTVLRVSIDTLKTKDTTKDAFLIGACVLMIAFVCEDFWSQASFLASSSCILGFILGWRRDNGLRLPLTKVARPQLATA